MGPGGIGQNENRHRWRRGIIVGTAIGLAAARRSSDGVEAQNNAGAPAWDDLLTTLDELGRLHENGVLSDYEFQLQKERLLGD